MLTNGYHDNLMKQEDLMIVKYDMMKYFINDEWFFEKRDSWDISYRRLENGDNMTDGGHRIDSLPSSARPRARTRTKDLIEVLEKSNNDSVSENSKFITDCLNLQEFYQTPYRRQCFLFFFLEMLANSPEPTSMQNSPNSAKHGENSVIHCSFAEKFDESDTLSIF